MADEVRVITFTQIPLSIQDLHHMAETGQMDEVRGRRVRFDIDEAVALNGAILKDAESVWLIYKEKVQ